MLEYGKKINESSIESKQKQIVIKSNELIQKSRFDLSLMEFKIIYSIIAQIQRYDTKFKLYKFSIKEFCQLCNIDEKNGNNYIYIKGTLKKLADKSMWVKFEDKGKTKETLIRWIDKPFINEHDGIIEVKLDDMLVPYLLELKEQFTEFSLLYILPMKSKYSPRIYEILKSYLNLNVIRITIDNLKDKLNIDKKKYNSWTSFRRRVLEPAIEEINLFTDIEIEYKCTKEGRAYKNIIFIIKNKSISDIENLYTNNTILTNEGNK